jgi:hypothetical protein
MDEADLAEYMRMAQDAFPGQQWDETRVMSLKHFIEKCVEMKSSGGSSYGPPKGKAKGSKGRQPAEGLALLIGE